MRTQTEPLQPIESLDRDDDGLAAAKFALDAALAKKALEPVLLDVRGMCSYAEFILLISGRSDRQVDAIAGAITKDLRERGLLVLGSEGKNTGAWELLDFGDLIVHVFHHPVREHFDLEGLWIDAPRVEIEIPEEARIAAEDSY